MDWFRVVDGRVAYRGRISHGPVKAWLATAEGAAAVDGLASQMRFRLLGRARAARRQIWRALESAARTEPLKSAIEAEPACFAASMSAMSYADGLPRAQVDLRRLVVVPRSLIAGHARDALRRRIWPLLTGVDDRVRVFFCEQLLTEIDRAIERAAPAPSRPVHARDDWSCVGTEREYVWIDPLWSGPAWLGHVLMYELPHEGLSRRDRKELERAVDLLKKGVTTLSQRQREGIVRLAAQKVSA